ncbi:glycosyltransferase involved in cell wall biosynthesis [Sphingobium sp. OAS761]|uniref:glycosyltransferase family 4 protein n=1 Tax=Sphingobium sp. OAS761 TaxID=2817901 RepID=UPI00209FFA17|nr:glycosyltransferase family 1 protein [Sphingobium sp. OAS761]MCP1469421.1 glycosyltransferase involved in cell wall biosynthesis [Sphingobium sp. OAS761]
MRIALFSGNYNYLREGANRALNHLVDYLERETGASVHAYSPVTDTPAFEPAGTLVPVRSITLPKRNEFRLALGISKSARDDLERFDPHIVHVSTPDILGVRAQSWAIGHGVPIVASMHTLFETYLDFYGLGWLRPLAEAHLRRFYRRADHVLAPTPELAAGLAAMRGDDRASVWSRGIDRNRFGPHHRDMAWRRSRGIADDEIAILFFGRLVLEKGIDVFIEAMRAAEATAKLHVVVVGEGPARPLFDHLENAVLLGHLEGDALSRAVASADIMLTPSTTETFGQVILESMASGVPVVSADAPNARALIEPFRTGLLCTPNDPQAFAASVSVLANAPSLRAAMGSAAREASSVYSWDEASRSVAAIYKRILAKDI